MTSCRIIYDGDEVEYSEALDGPFVFQTLRCRGYEPLLVRSHMQYLDSYAYRIFGSSAQFGEKMIRDCAGKLFKMGNYSEQSTNFLSLRVYSSSHYAVLPAGSSLYGAYSLRALRPRAVRVQTGSSTGMEFCSVGLHNALIGRIEARKNKCTIALDVDHMGYVNSIDGHAPAIILKNYVVVDDSGSGVEMRILCEAFRLTGRSVKHRRIHESEIELADELMYIDHEGLTSVAQYGEIVYSDIVAYHVAQKLEQAQKTLEMR